MVDKFLQITNNMIDEANIKILKALAKDDYIGAGETTYYKKGLAQAIANYEVTREQREGCDCDGTCE